MAEYIESDRYLRWSDIKDALMEYHGEQVMSKYLTVAECRAARFGIEGALREIENLPAADVAPVVRCKDCKWLIYDDDVDFVCAQIGKYMGFDDFCSHGERKDGE